MCPMQHWGHAYTKRVFALYLKLKCNWVACILFATSGHPRP